MSSRALKSILAVITKPSNDWQSFLLTNWSVIIGNLSGKVCLEKIEGATLVLGVYDSCWMQELYLLSDLLIDTINKHLDNPHVKSLRFKKGVRPIKKKREGSRGDFYGTIPESTNLTSYMLSAHEKQLLEKIKDQDLRFAIERFLVRCSRKK